MQTSTQASPRSAGVSQQSPEPGHAVRGRDGLHGEIEHVVGAGDRLIVRLSDGTRALLEAEHLDEGEGQGIWTTNLSAADIDRARSAVRGSASSGGAAAGAGAQRDQAVIVVPVIEERVSVDKQAIQTGRVRVRKIVREEEQELDQELLQQEVRVERVAVNQTLEPNAQPPQPRHEGETLIIPLLEEVLVVEKRLVVREEMRITRQTTSQNDTRKVTVRREEAQVERLPPESADSPRRQRD